MKRLAMMASAAVLVAVVMIATVAAARVTYTLTISKFESGLVGFSVEPAGVVFGQVWVRNRCWDGGTLVRDEALPVQNLDTGISEAWPLKADGTSCEAYVYLYHGAARKPAGPVLAYVPS
jgi:hypothetical protein